MKFPTIEEIAQDVADKALDEIEYKGKTLRQWIEIIFATEIYANNDAISRRELQDKFEQWQKTDGYSNDEWNLLVDVLSVIKSMPPAPQLSTNLAEVGTDAISRKQAIDALRDYLVEKRCPDDGTLTCRLIENEVINKLPPIRPDKDKVSNLLYHIYSIQSPHLDMNGVIAKKYYCEELWKELFGKESELPEWMT